MYATAITIFIGMFNYRHRYEPEYEILKETDDAFASYRDGYVYIGREEFINSVKHEENDVLVVDERDSIDSNIKILDSYRITDKNAREDIINIIEEYEKNDPSIWSRSIETMKLEWFVDNVLYNLNYELTRTKDVDFENSEEESYKRFILSK